METGRYGPSDEESVRDFLYPQSTTPMSEPPGFNPEVVTDTETEVLASPPLSPSKAPTQREFDWSARTRASDSYLSQRSSPPAVPSNFTPPGTPPSGTPALGPQPYPQTTPPRQIPLSGSILDFRTPSPPHDLPGPPPFSDEDALGTEGTPIKPGGQLIFNPNNTAMKTPRPPGAWVVAPLQNKPDPRPSSPTHSSPMQSAPMSVSTPLSRANSYPETHWKPENAAKIGLVTPTASLSRASSLPLRTPAPPGAWMATPNQLGTQNGAGDQSQFGSIGRRRSILKVRFNVAESEASAAEGPLEDPPVSAIRLTNPELPVAKPSDASTEQGRTNADAVVNGPASPAIISVPPRPAAPERPSTPVSRDNAPSPRSLRKSPSVRVVDAYGRERVDNKAPAETVSQNGYADATRKTDGSLQSAPPSTPRSTSRSMVRIVDAMGRVVDDASEERREISFEADTSTVSDDTPLGHAAALARMRQTLRDLAEGLSDADRSVEDLALDSSHLEELDEVSKAARLARNQLAQNLRIEMTKELGVRRNHSSRKAVWASRILPDAISNGKSSWSRAIMYWGVIIQLILVIVMWRYAHIEARRLFYTTYYDPLYPELYPIQGSSYLTGTLSPSRPRSMLESYDTIRREGWTAFCRELLHALTHAGDRLWESWREYAYTDIEKPT
ncbi:hypothetical protein F5I97DRAFT_729324 [Phlebopus sp. FC_14]|nr:hypothetical protein F5I97DRAFT_729324 [Phlebopus sp. FC_14]